MICWKCGKEVQEGQRFCAHCGADLSQESTQGSAQESTQGQAAQDKKPSSALDFLKGGNASMPLKIFAIVCAAFYGIRAIVFLFTTLRDLFQFLGGYRFMLKYCIANIPMMILSVFVCLVLLTMAFFRSSKNADGLFILFSAGVIVRFLYGIILQAIYGYGFKQIGTQALLTLMLAVIVIGAWFLCSMLMNEMPLASKNKDAMVESLKDVATTVQSAFAEARQKADEAKVRAQSARNNAAFNAQTSAASGAPNNVANNVNVNVPVPVGGTNGGNRPLLKTDRSLIVFILLNIVTCGIYGLWFIHALARDVNIACEGDGKKTSGLLAFILLSLITCGIYGFIWYYSLGNRLAINAVKYNMHFQENGTTVLMWQLFGAFLCGIGPFIAMHIIIKNANSLFAAYNNNNY